ncbi:hypothetical protein FRB96_006825 [Tulasnella sp. 330]|nr:hypothetical protein FRB96_006825 [Tulasnella sp. 330]KAG8870959.1 hypothetical protein FRB98_001232 [Tulasnella sp. 332]
MDGKEDAPLILQWWIDLGAMVDIREEDLRAEVAAERKRVMGSKVVGCSWFKGVRYQQESNKALLYRCAGCGHATYCGFLCQERDWVDGDHKTQCGQRDE